MLLPLVDTVVMVWLGLTWHDTALGRPGLPVSQWVSKYPYDHAICEHPPADSGIWGRRESCVIDDPCPIVSTIAIVNILCCCVFQEADHTLNDVYFSYREKGGYLDEQACLVLECCTCKN